MGKNLWVFGDSFSSSFKNKKEDDCSYEYIKHKGYRPKVFSEIISETMSISLFDLSIGGATNQMIFNEFASNLNRFNDDDIFIFGWTQNTRFNVATKENYYLSFIAGGANENTYKSTGIPFQSMVDVSINRLNHSVFWIEVINYIKVINHILKKNKTFHWTWVEPSNKNGLSQGDYQNEFYGLLLPFKKYPSITVETNNLVNDLHWGEIAHTSFSIDLLNYINSTKKIL